MTTPPDAPHAPAARDAPAALDVHLVVERDGFALDASLTAPAGSTTALLGPNGAGKSTALAAIAGLLPLDDGHVRLGVRTWDDPARGVLVAPRDRRVGIVFQDGLLFDHLTVLDNVAFGPRSRGASTADAADLARRWLERLGVADLATRRPTQLSGGQAQRVALARALADEPRLLLLDEPLSALDVTGRAALRRVLATHLDDLPIPRVLVTHDPVEAFLLADRVVVLEDGRVTQVGTPDELRQRPRTDYAADLAGTNLFRGTAHAGTVSIGDHELVVADTTVSGPVLVTVHPHAVTLAPGPVEGSPRNAWPTTVTHVDAFDDRARVSVGAPLPLTAEVTTAAVAALDLAPGRAIHLAIKATELTTTPDPR